MVKGINIFDIVKKDPSQFDLSMERVMNEQPFEGGKYQTYHMGLQFDVAQEGELYMIAQGAGGGYGDVLERDPENVLEDLRLDRISDRVARDIYRVAWDPETFAVDAEETQRMRDAERQARLKRSKPYAEFVKEFVKEEPPADVPYFGSWGQENDEHLYATVWGHNGPERVEGTVDEIPLITVPNRHVVKIGQLEERIRELEARYEEVTQHRT